jgi:hypothetical protein
MDFKGIVNCNTFSVAPSFIKNNFKNVLFN